MNTKNVGDIAEAALTLRLLQAGYDVLRPVGDNSRYDLVVSKEGGAFLRVQVKSGVFRNGAVYFRTCSSYAHRRRGTADYRGQADIFGVYCPTIGRCYLVPVDHVGRSGCALRIDRAKNAQEKLIRLAADFEI